MVADSQASIANTDAISSTEGEEQICDIYESESEARNIYPSQIQTPPPSYDIAIVRRTDLSESDCKNAVLSISTFNDHDKVLDAHGGPGRRTQQQRPTPKKPNFIVQYFKKKSHGFSRSQFLTIVILSFVEFFASTVISIQAPFYPYIARQKGATPTEYGFVFGIFQIVVFIMSPIYGAKMSSLGPTRVFNCGILVTGVCCIIFGLLDAITDRKLFIWSCLLVRVVEAMGDAAFETASFTIIAYEFPNSVATNFATLEIFYGVGLIIGPSLGGALYEIGGYRLPFLSMGGLLFTSAIVTYLYLPESSSRQAQEQQRQASNKNEESQPDQPTPDIHGGFHMFRMLLIPVIAVIAYSIVAATTAIGFLSSNFEHHLEQFHLSKFAVGAVFILDGGIYAITAPIWGWICDHSKSQKFITFIGAIFTILGFILIGPIPYFPYDTTLYMSCFGLVLLGFGSAATLVSAFLQLLKDAIKHGYPDDISTYGLVSGLWTSMAALGYFVGPSVGGILVDHTGFRWASLFIIGTQIILIIILGGFYAPRTLSYWRNGKSATLETWVEEDRRNHNNPNSKTFNPVLLKYANESEVAIKASSVLHAISP